MSSPSAPKKTETKVTQNTIDPAMLPYYTDVAKRAQGMGNTPYVPYTGETVAGFDPMETAAQNATKTLTSPGEYNQAQAGYQRGMDYNPGMFGAAEAAQYMSPYQKNVTDIGIRDLNEQAARSMALAGINSARTGGYGGSGNAIMNATTARTLNRDVGDLSTKGAQESYLNAQQQYQRDRTAREYAETLNQNSASGLASLGNTRQTSDLARIGAQNAAGTARRDLAQRLDDKRYEEFVDQRDYGKNQITWESQLLNGLPMGSYEQATTYKTPSNSASQLAGVATALGGAYNDSQRKGTTYAKGGSVMSGLTTGPFQNLDDMRRQLMQLTPQQMAKVSELGTAPPYMIIAAMNAQDNIRQQGQPAAGPAAPPVAQQVVDKSVGAPPAGQAMPAPQAPTQMAARGGYIHDYGVASLPYEANYGHGGIVSFAAAGEVKAPPAAAEGVQEQNAAIKYMQENPRKTEAAAAVLALGLAAAPSWAKAAYAAIPSGFKSTFAKYGLEFLKKAAVPTAAVVGTNLAIGQSLKPDEAPPKESPSATQNPVDPADTEVPPENDPFAGLGGFGRGAATIQRTELPALVPLQVPEAQSAEQLQERQDQVNANYGVGKDFYEQERARNDAKLSALEAQRKGVYSGQGLMDFGAALASGESSNFLDNFAGAVPAYTGAIKSGNEYARNRQDLLDTHADLLRGQQRSENRSDAANMLAAETTSRDAKRAGDNANTAAQNERASKQAELDIQLSIENAKLAESALDRGSKIAIASIEAKLRTASASPTGLSANQRQLALVEYSNLVRKKIEDQAVATKMPPAEIPGHVERTIIAGFNNYLETGGINSAFTSTSSKVYPSN